MLRADVEMSLLAIERSAMRVAAILSFVKARYEKIVRSMLEIEDLHVEKSVFEEM